MNPLIRYIFEQQNPEEAFLSIAQMLEEKNYTSESCYTYESLCRLQDDENKVEKYTSEIIRIQSAFCVNSYDLFYLQHNPVQYEFPIKNENNDEFEIIKMADRYMAVLHLLMILEDENEITCLNHPLSKFRSYLLLQSQNIQNKDYLNHLYNIMTSEENKTASILTEFNNPEVLMTAIYIASKYEQAYIKLLKMYVKQRRFKEAFDFYNKYYASTFNKKIVESEKEILEIIDAIEFI